ncbi:hypothetical protein SAMN04487926_15320 [Paraburkholderia steynii]|uniref:Uncharacterized protein n=1 Tax=Paraburkholderia steynii TaxID=1245441 RepID=A0A7Z7FNX3_9BURK|nr:hypothetical protein SAMN04487926_15320 [Paraburkholderia steynii]
MRAITARHSLFPRSHTHLPNSFPRGLPAVAKRVASADNWAYHVPVPAGPINSRVCPFSTCLSPGSAYDDVLPFVTEATGCSPFGLGLTAALAHFVLRGLQQFTYVVFAELALHLTPRGGWQCRFLPRRRGEPSVERHVVFRASHLTVTGHACLNRQLLVVQQVAALAIVHTNTERDKK